MMRTDMLLKIGRPALMFRLISAASANLITLMLLLFSFQSLAMKVILLTPTVPGTPFWDLTVEVAVAAAEDLNIELEVRYGGIDRYHNLEVITAIAQAKNKADYVIFLPLNGNLRSAFLLLNDANIHFITLENNLTKSDLTYFNESINEFYFWVGHIYYDDMQAGSLLADYLLTEAEKRNFSNISITALSGDYSEIAAKRELGLLSKVIKKQHLNQVIKTMWEVDRVESMMPSILSRYINTNIYWTASDVISNTVYHYLKSNKQTTDDILIGGIGWLPIVYEKIRGGQISASVGGHFLQGAWAIIKAYDHHQGIKSEHKVQINHELMNLLNINSFSFVQPSFTWNQVDFSQFSLSVNKELKQHNFQFDYNLMQPRKAIKNNQQSTINNQQSIINN